MGYFLLKVKFVKVIHKPTRNNFPSFLLALEGYVVVSIISEEEFYNLSKNIPKNSVICVNPNNYNLERNELEVYKKYTDKAVGEELRRALIHYGML